MPYLRAYQIPPLSKVKGGVSEESTQTLLNITPSSNWIQETFNQADQVEDAEDGRLFVIEKATRSSLYQKIIAMQVREEIFNLDIIASELEPSAKILDRLAEEANGDLAKLAQLKKEWEKRMINGYSKLVLSDMIKNISEERILLDADLILPNDCNKVKLTISSPDLPVKGDLPITAVLHSKTDGEPIQFSWTDKSGFLSTMLILPNVIYPIQPVSIDFSYELTLLA